MNAPALASRLCTFFVGDHHLGIPVAQVQEILRAQPLTHVPLAPRLVRGLMNLRGRIAVVLDLRRRLELPERAPEAPSFHVVVESEGGVVSLLVDAVGDVLDVPEASFEAPPETLRGAARALIRGAYKLERGLLLALETERAIHIQAEA